MVELNRFEKAIIQCLTDLALTVKDKLFPCKEIFIHVNKFVEYEYNNYAYNLVEFFNKDS